METYQNTDLLTTYNGKGSIVAVLRQLEIIFRQMQLPDVEGIQIFSFLAQNLEGDGKGNFTITVDTLENVIEIVGTPSLFLRNHSGVLQVSADHKLTWAEIGSGSGGTGDMLEAEYSDDAENPSKIVWRAGTLANFPKEWVLGTLFYADQSGIASLWGSFLHLFTQDSAPASLYSGPRLYCLEVEGVQELHVKFSDDRDIKIA